MPKRLTSQTCEDQEPLNVSACVRRQAKGGTKHPPPASVRIAVDVTDGHRSAQPDRGVTMRMDRLPMPRCWQSRSTLTMASPPSARASLLICPMAVSFALRSSCSNETGDASEGVTRQSRAHRCLTGHDDEAVGDRSAFDAINVGDDHLSTSPMYSATIRAGTACHQDGTSSGSGEAENSLTRR